MTSMPPPPPPPLSRVLFLAGLLMIPPFGVAAAIVVPQYRAMQVRAHREDVPQRLDLLRRGVLEAFAQEGAYPSLPRCPGDLKLRTPTPWGDECLSAYKKIGFRPPNEGTWCAYVVEGGETFRAIARCDLDGDRHPAVFEATQDGPAIRTSGPTEY
jgi:hypothetical protein